MISPEQLQQQVQSLIQQPAPFDWMTDSVQLDSGCEALQLPTRKTENWKYSPLTALYRQSFFDSDNIVNRLSADQTGTLSTLYSSIEHSHRLVFVDGVFQANLSAIDELKQQGQITLFSQATEQQQAIINHHLSQSGLEPNQPFSIVNRKSCAEGILIHAGKDCVFSKPVHVVHLSTTKNSASLTQSRLLVVAEPHAQLQLIEQFDSETGELNTAHNHVTQIFLKANARLTHLRLQVEDESQIHINGLYVRLDRDSHYEQHALAFGSQLKRNDIQVHFDANNAYCRLNGVFLSKHQQHIDNHLILEHAVPHCNSDTEYKGFITDKSRAVFDGRIHIHKQAQKTEAHLSNKNLLLSKQAELNTKPELEIYADDVKCSHGATIGQLDEKSLFYFQSRGIDKASAEAMLCLGFVNEMIERFPNEQVKQLATGKLAAFFNDVANLKQLWSMDVLEDNHD